MIRLGKFAEGAGRSICRKSEIAPWLVAGLIWVAAASQAPADSPDDPAMRGVEPGGLSATEKGAGGPEQSWNWHVQNTDIGQGDFGFPAKYDGPASLNSEGEAQETITLDVFAGARLWRGAEAHTDGLMWQGFGLTQTHGVEAFPNGDAYKAGAENAQFNFARLFIRQTIGLGGEQEAVPN